MPKILIANKDGVETVHAIGLIVIFGDDPRFDFVSLRLDEYQDGVELFVWTHESDYRIDIHPSKKLSAATRIALLVGDCSRAKRPVVKCTQ